MTLNGLVHVCDWYATFCSLAGADPWDSRAHAAGLPPVDSIDQWGYLSGKSVTPARTQMYADTAMLINGTFKYLSSKENQACWSGPVSPNSSAGDMECTTTECGSGGCLFNIFDDPTEHVNLAEDPAYAPQLNAMASLLAELNKGYFNPDRGGEDARACDQSQANGDFYGPWLP